MKKEILLTTKKTLSILGISRYQLNAYRKQGKIHAEKIGRNKYYKEEEVLRFKPILEKLLEPSPLTILKKQQAFKSGKHTVGIVSNIRPPANSPLQSGMSLCWICTKVYSGCSWARTQTPVPGWDAVLLDNEEYPASRGVYRVKNCPEFEWDEHYYDEKGILRRKAEIRNKKKEMIKND